MSVKDLPSLERTCRAHSTACLIILYSRKKNADFLLLSPIIFISDLDSISSNYENFFSLIVSIFNVSPSPKIDSGNMSEFFICKIHCREN